MRRDLKDRITKKWKQKVLPILSATYFGLDTSEYSFTYYCQSGVKSKDMKALRASMDTIRKTSAEVIEEYRDTDARAGNGKTSSGYFS